MPPYQLVRRPDNGKRYVASLPRVWQMSHARTFIWPYCVHPLPNVPRQQDLDEVEQDVGQQVEKEQRGPVFACQCLDVDLGGLDLVPFVWGGASSYTSSTLLIQRQFGLIGQARNLVRSPCGPPPGSRSHPACATCMTYGRWYEPNHRYLNIPYTCTWVLYEYYS